MRFIYDLTALGQLRREMEWPVAGLAKRARLSKQAIHAIERGAVPSAVTLGRLATALRVSVERFYRVSS